MSVQDMIAGAFPSGFRGLLARFSTKAAEIKARTEARRKNRKGYALSGEEAYAMSKLEQVRRTRQITLDAYEHLWVKCILYTAGQQHLRYLTTTRTWEPVQHEEWLPYPTTNYIQPKVQRAVDFFTRHEPRGQCVPETDHEDDREAAKHGDSILRHLGLENRDADKRDEAATLLLTVGNTFWRTWVDSGSALPEPVDVQVGEEPLLAPDTQQPIIGPDGQPVMTTRYMETRDPVGIVQPAKRWTKVRTDVLGPFAMVVPLAAPRLEDAPWCCEVSMHPLELLRRLYPDKADYIGESSPSITSDLYTHRILSLLSMGSGGLLSSLDPYSLEGYGVTWKYEEQPTREFPTGILIFALDGLPLVIDELPLRNRYSYEHMGYHRVMGRFWCRGMVEDLLSPQDNINKIDQFCQANDNHNSMPTWLIPDQANVPEGINCNKPNSHITYKAPFKPEVFQGVSMPAQMIQRRAMYIEDMDEISSVRNVLMGDAPSGVRAGVAINRLREEAEGGFEPIAKRWDSFIARSEESKLLAVALYWNEPQHFSIEGDDGTITEVRDFVGSMLRSTRQFRIISGSWRPRSLTSQQQLALELAQGGLLPTLLLDPEQHRKFLDLMGLEGFEAEQSADYKRAKLENEMLRRSVGWETVIREPADDDMIHLAVHAKERKKPEWARLPNLVKQRYLAHEVEHLEAILQAQGMPDPANFTANPGALEGTEEGNTNPEGQSSNGTPESNSRRAATNGGSDAQAAQ